MKKLDEKLTFNKVNHQRLMKPKTLIVLAFYVIMGCYLNTTSYWILGLGCMLGALEILFCLLVFTKRVRRFYVLYFTFVEIPLLSLFALIVISIFKAWS